MSMRHSVTKLVLQDQKIAAPRMLKNIQKVVRLLMLCRQQKAQQQCCRSSKGRGGLLVLLWAGPGSSDQGQLNCTIAAAGPWCAGVKMEEVQPELLEKLSSSAGPCPEPDPEELCGFTETYGPLLFLLSSQVRDGSSEWRSDIEAFLHSFSRTNAGVKVYLRLKTDHETYQRLFSVKIQSTVRLKDQQPVVLDVNCSTRPPVCMGGKPWCAGGHPVLGDRLPLSIPPEAMEKGLYGELSLQPVSLLSPCVLQYPNLATQLTCIQVFVYSPSNLPITGPSAFLQHLPAGLDCQDLGLDGLRCSPSHVFTDTVHRGGTIYTVDRGNCEEPEPKWSPTTVDQSLSLFLFLQHSDPFTSQLADTMASEELIECHLEAILSNNRQAVTTALHAEIKNALKPQRQRRKAQEKLAPGLQVMMSSVISVVSCSSNVNFRAACLDTLKVCDTRELSASLCETLERVTSWKFVPSGKCYPAETDAPPIEPKRKEI